MCQIIRTRWNISPKEAIRTQYRLKKMIVLRRLPLTKIHLLAGVDVSVKNNTSKAAIVVLTFPGLKIVETVSHAAKTTFPYIPGLLTFREGAVILECIKKLSVEPDLFIFDGQGLAHPRGMGIASHMGLLLNKPSIGSAKSHLFGEYKPVGKRKGAFSLMKDKEGKSVGAALCSRDNTKPIFVSPGHLTDIPSVVKIILACCKKYRIPEPIRAAHHAAGASENSRSLPNQG